MAEGPAPNKVGVTFDDIWNLENRLLEVVVRASYLSEKTINLHAVLLILGFQKRILALYNTAIAKR